MVFPSRREARITVWVANDQNEPRRLGALPMTGKGNTTDEKKKMVGIYDEQTALLRNEFRIHEIVKKS